MAEFDIDGELVRTLAALMDETGLTEIEIADGERSIRISKAAQAAAAPAVAVAPAAASASEEAASGEAVSLADHPGAVVAPMVGTAYTSPEPGADPDEDVQSGTCAQGWSRGPDSDQRRDAGRVRRAADHPRIAPPRCSKRS
jgi:hypothetical protein